MPRTMLPAIVILTLAAGAWAQQLVVGKEVVTRNDALKATLKLKAAARGDGKLALTWTDSYGRTVAAVNQDVKVDGDSVDIKFPLAPAAAMLNFLEGELKLGDQTIKVPKTEFVVTPDPARWDDYQIFMYYAYKTPQQQTALRDCGITCGQIQSSRTQDPNGAGAWWQCDYRFYCDQINILLYANYHSPAYKEKDKLLKDAKVEYRKDRTSKQPFYRNPCFHDPAARETAAARMRQAATAQMRFKPFFYGTDECGVANLVEAWDFCFDPRTIQAMRQWLLKQYGSLEALNKEWGTDFKKLEDVVPLDTDEMMARKKPDGSPDDNYSPWADHRTFMNETFAGALKEGGDALKSVDPTALAGILGGQMPGAFGGYDYWLLSQALDAIEPYNIGNNREIWRSFAPRKPACTTGFGFGDMEIWRLWYQALHGDVGLIIYDEENRYLDADAKPTQIGAGVAPTYKELTGGVVKQLQAMERVDDPIYIHYSQPSITAHWMIEVRPSGQNWVNRGSATERKASDFLRLRESWVRLPEDNSLGYGFVSYEQLGGGAFDKFNAKVLILPQSIAMSKAECDAVRRFVAAGGTAIADCRLALMDEHCRTLPKGQLDDLFGIERSDTKYAPGQPGLKSQVLIKELLSWHNMDKLAVAEPGVKSAAGARAMFADAKGMPAFIVNKQGKGTTIYMNAVVTDYHRWRMRPPEGEPLRQYFGQLFKDAGINPQYAISEGGEGKYANIVAEVHPFKSGDLRIVGLHRNYQIRTNELGPPEYQKQDALEQPLKVKIGFGSPVAVYDQRAGKFLGKMAEAVVELNKHQPTILALLPEPAEKMTVTAPAEVKVGEIIQARFQLVGPKLGDVHAFRVRLLDGQGKELEMLTRNILAPKGQGQTGLPVALSDPKGEYTLQVRDVATGIQAEQKIAVK